MGSTRTLTDAGFAHLAGLKHLERLVVTRAPKITSKGVAHLAGLPLQRVTLQWSMLDDAGLASLARIKTLTHLHVGRSRKVTDVGVAKLAALPKLRTLNVSFAHGVTDETLAKLVKLPLTDLDLTSAGCAKSVTSMKFTDAGLRLLATMPTLKRVVLYRAPHVTSNGVAKLRATGRSVLFNGGD